MNRKLKRFLSMFLALMMVFSGISFTPSAVRNVYAASASDYGLMDDVQDGVILHAWEWSFNNIKDNMQKIAESGYTAVQTSVIQQAKEGTKGKTNEVWWVYYQPANFTIDNTGNSALGTKAEFQAMCDEAHKYGIKVIVDVVANHLGNASGYDLSSAIPEDIRNDSSCWHANYNKEINNMGGYSNRWAATQCSMGGLPDLNTGSSKIQNYVLTYLKECIDAGADGFRFDAAKHIELPDDDSSYASNFWPTVINGAKSYYKTKGYYKSTNDLYCYGEILDGSNTASITSYTKYMKITDNNLGNNVRGSMSSKNAEGVKNSLIAAYKQNANGSDCVLWAESHDTYSNDNKESTYVSDSDINKTWALVASKSYATSLYFARTAGYRGGKIGDICSTQCFNKEVVEVNKFHNYFNGQSEYTSSSNNIVYNERGTSGVILVNVTGGSQQVSVKANKMANGTYKDQVTGNTFTVSGGTISGQIGDTGIAVVYNAEPIVTTPTATISQEGGSFSSDTLTLTLGLKNATSGTYKIGSAAAQTFTSSKTITIGSDMSYGDSVTVTLTATDGSNSYNKSYTFTKTEVTGNVAYLKLPSGWGTPVYCYAYDFATEKVNNGTWPGAQMAYDSATGYYKYEIPSDIAAPRVIFYNSDSNRYPADMQKGLLFETDGSWIYDGSTWKTYTPPATKGTVTVKYVDESGKEITSSKTLTGTVGSSYTTTAATVSGYTLKTTPSNASGVYTSSAITVTYIYSVVSSTDPTVTSSLADGSSFKTETQTITLTLKNATSGTYSVDNGPTKSFTGSTSVVLGQGKVADSTVTVKATATSSSGTTKTYTFSYNKVFNGTVNEETNAVSTATEYSSYNASGSSLDSQYATNPNGVGIKKTITVDGSISDWDSSMIIAQGAANDDPRVYRDNSMYEVPIDLYTLYGCYDDTNLYLMWEMTNVQDVVAPNDNYPLSQGILYQTMNVPFFIAIDTGDSSTAIGNDCQTSSGGTIWGSGITIKNNVNKVIAISTNGANGPFIYGGTSAGLNAKEEYNSTTAGITFKYGLGILSSKVMGINGAYGTNNNRVVGDMTKGSTYVDFNSKGHSSSTMDFHYEMAIPLEKLGTSASSVASNGLGVLLIATMGKSGMDCLPYDTAMNDNADQPDTESQEFNSYEKSDADEITTSFARIGKSSGSTPIIVNPTSLELNFGADRSSPQSSGTALTLSGIAKGGTAPYTYKYYVNGTAVGTKSGSGETQVSWTPSAGSYTIKCVVTDSAGNTATSAKKYTVEGTSDSALTVTLKASTTSAKVGDKVTFTGSAAGGSESYTYSYIVYNKTTGQWGRIVDNATSPTLTWTAGSAGDRQFYLDVKDSAGKIVRSTAATVSVTAGTSALAVTASADKTAGAVGDTVTITAKASGGSGNYTYSLIVYNKTTGQWGRVADNVSSSTITWKAGSVGDRQFYVDVKDSTGKIVRSAAINVVTSSGSNALSVTATADKSNPAIGAKVIFTAKASGGSGSYTYSLIVYNKTTGQWGRVADNVSSSSITWTAGSAGDRQFYVDVKDSTGKIVRSAAVNVVTASGSNTLSVTATADKTSAAIGNKVTFTAKASGGSGTYKYSLIVYNKTTGQWARIADNVSASTFTWTAGSKGTRQFYIDVKDSTGKVVRSAAMNVTTN